MRTTDPKRELPFILWSSALRQTARMRVLIVEDEVRMANLGFARSSQHPDD